MRRSDFLIKTVSLIAFIAMAVHIGYSLYYARVNRLRTVLAVSVSAAESETAEGYAVREEYILNGGGDGVYITAAEGEKVAVGGEVAVIYYNRTAVERSEQIAEARHRLAAYRALLGGRTLADAASDAVLELAYAVRGGGISELPAVRAEIDAYIFGDVATYTESKLKQEAASLEGQLESLTTASFGDTERITAPESGIFSSKADGYESVSPDMLESLTRTGLNELFENAKEVPEDVVGRIVTGLRWYFVTEIPSAAAARLEEGLVVSIRFSKTYSGEINMRTEYIGNNENGMRVAVFSSGQYMHELAQIRELFANVQFSTAKGIRAPREALHIDDEGQTFVYVLVGVRSERANVMIIYESEDYYILEPESGTRLIEGAEMIVGAGDIYDGKAVM